MPRAGLNVALASFWAEGNSVTYGTGLSFVVTLHTARYAPARVEKSNVKTPCVMPLCFLVELSKCKPIGNRMANSHRRTKNLKSQIQKG